MITITIKEERVGATTAITILTTSHLNSLMTRTTLRLTGFSTIKAASLG
jgi:hypothetical protein